MQIAFFDIKGVMLIERGLEADVEAKTPTEGKFAEVFITIALVVGNCLVRNNLLQN